MDQSQLFPQCNLIFNHACTFNTSSLFHYNYWMIETSLESLLKDKPLYLFNFQYTVRVPTFLQENKTDFMKVNPLVTMRLLLCTRAASI